MNTPPTTPPTALAQPTVLPVHHLNGTGAPAIWDEYSRANTAVKAALEALCQCTLHQRDFYPRTEGAFVAWNAAQDQRAEALNALRAIEAYTAAWAKHALEAIGPDGTWHAKPPQLPVSVHG
jgi:aspartate aminotransferase-like enzyme